jgi:arylsulfatase A-like enzyme
VGKKGLFRGTKTELVAATSAHQDAWRNTFSQSIPGGPMSRGFDYYFGTDVPNWPPFCFIEQDKTVGIPAQFLPAKLLVNHQASLQGPALPGWRLEPILPALGNRTCEYISRASKDEQSFFVYLPLTSPHTPLAVNDVWKGKSRLNLYADFVMETDALVGQVLDSLEQHGVADKTLVIFTSDNGCAPYIGVPELENRGHYPSGSLRGYKSDVWEGGHRVPFIVRWPGHVDPKSTCKQLVHQADLIATCAAVVGAELGANEAEDSFSLLPLLKGGVAPVREHAVSQSSGGLIGIRQGSWKLIFGPGSGGWGKGRDDLPAQLYNLADDLGETKNLYAARPEKVKELTVLMERLVKDGRSTPGLKQMNDKPFDWKRFMAVSNEQANR